MVRISLTPSPCPPSWSGGYRSFQKQRAPAPPSGNATLAQTIYGTLPHAPRNSQNMDPMMADYRLGLGGIASVIGGKSQPDVYSTLPHLRNMDGAGGGVGSGGKSAVSSFAYHYENKSYERFEPLITASQQAKYDKHKLDQANETPVVLTTFGHKRSPSGESLSRNLQLAGAKLVLPTGGEMPQLKPVDKSLVRPKLPPPGPPPGTTHTSPLAGHSSLVAAQNNGANVTNGRSSESINSMNDTGPVAPPRKVSFWASGRTNFLCSFVVDFTSRLIPIHIDNISFLFSHFVHDDTISPSISKCLQTFPFLTVRLYDFGHTHKIRAYKIDSEKTHASRSYVF